MRFSENLCLVVNRRPTNPEARSRTTGTSLRAGAARLALLLAFMVGAAAPSFANEPKPGNIVKVFVGTIETMDSHDQKAEAVGVDARGLIVAVGTRDDVLHMAGLDPKLVVIKLNPGEALLPGFFDAHLHLDALLLKYSGLAEMVGPCLPKPYESANTANCRNYIKDTFTVVRDKLDAQKKPAGDAGLKKLNETFVVGLNLDPSRQPYAPATSTAPVVASTEFKTKPKFYIEKDLTPTRPVLIIDQSGHFGYVNSAAFTALKKTVDAACLPKTDCWPPTLGAGGEWNRTDACTQKNQKDTGDIDCYTGLLTEQTGFTPFYQAVGNSALGDYDGNKLKYVEEHGATRKGVLMTLEAFRTAGVTTVTSMADSADEVIAWRTLAELPESGTRVVSILTAATANDMANKMWKGKNLAERDSNGVPMPIGPFCNPLNDPDCRLPRDLGVSGIKVVLDGSTQGCTAALWMPVSYRASSECSPLEGRSNYNGEQLVELSKSLKPLWDAGTWRFEFHANGNRAFDTALNLFSSLQYDHANNHTATIIHATLVEEDHLWDRAQQLRNGTYAIAGKNVRLDLRLSHLIGHVAYWGNVFERQLGKDDAKNVDPTASDVHYAIPFTLHSDATVSVPIPLWFVRQAVTRETWTYPALEQVSVLGEKQRISIRDAIRAVTIRAAEEKELSHLLGSIEVGKVADFVVLSANPMDEKDPAKISSIQVKDTYLGGMRTKPIVLP
jgi:predicted amidohydrolase YtcJ